VLRGIGGSSDGKGKGITAPNPVGQKLAVQRAWENAGLSPATATFVEGHGTSTKVGDVVEVESLTDVFSKAGAAPNSIALGSVKSNFGHLKGAAGAAGILKTCLALNDPIRISISVNRLFTSMAICGNGKNQNAASGVPRSAPSDLAAPISTRCSKNTSRGG